MSMERFLRYSLDHDREIRMIWMEAGQMRQGKVVVRRLEGGMAELYVCRPPRRTTVPVSDIFSCDYVKGDDGLN